MKINLYRATEHRVYYHLDVNIVCNRYYKQLPMQFTHGADFNVIVDTSNYEIIQVEQLKPEYKLLDVTDFLNKYKLK